MQETHRYLQEHSKVPLFICANLEDGGSGIAIDGTNFGKQMQAAAGHTTADMTLKHYIKGRQQNSNMAIPIANRYGMTG